jgi:hypothetical protein
MPFPGAQFVASVLLMVVDKTVGWANVVKAVALQPLASVAVIV